MKFAVVYGGMPSHPNTLHVVPVSEAWGRHADFSAAPSEGEMAADTDSFAAVEVRWVPPALQPMAVGTHANRVPGTRCQLCPQRYRATGSGFCNVCLRLAVARVRAGFVALEAPADLVQEATDIVVAESTRMQQLHEALRQQVSVHRCGWGEFSNCRCLPCPRTCSL